MDIAALQNKKRELENRLSEMEEIKRDLEAIERVSRILNGTQTSNLTKSEANEKPVSDEKAARTASIGYGDVLETLETAVKKFSASFTSTQVHDHLVAVGHDLNRSSIAGALRKLCDKGVITMVEEGRGRRPSKYVNAQQTFDTVTRQRIGIE